MKLFPELFELLRSMASTTEFALDLEIKQAHTGSQSV